MIISMYFKQARIDPINYCQTLSKCSEIKVSKDRIMNWRNWFCLSGLDNIDWKKSWKLMECKYIKSSIR